MNLDEASRDDLAAGPRARSRAAAEEGSRSGRGGHDATGIVPRGVVARKEPQLVVDRSNVSALDEEEVRTCIGEEKQMRTKAFIGGAALAVATLSSSYGLAGDEPAVPAATAMPGGREMMDSMCPMKVKGTAVKARNVDGGVALVFTTKTGDVEDVRQRVRHMTQMHGTNAAGMMTTTTVSGVNRTPAEVKIRSEPLPASTASAEDVERGARLVLRPKDPAQLPKLRRQVRTLAESMAHLHGECPEMAVTVEAAPSAPGRAEGSAQQPAPKGQ